MKRLLALAILALLTISLTTSQPTTSAAPVDCALVVQLCRESNAHLYDLCIALTGDYTACALQEAQNNISCITGNGCDVPKGPPDN